MAYAFSLINGVTLAGQMALGVGAALRGNGMCLSTSGLRRVPWQAHGLAEDLEYSWMVRINGERIAFERAAVVRATMLADGGEAWDSQRRRWESGRHQLRSRMLRPVLGSRHLGLLDKLALAVELTMPTASTLCTAYLLLSVLLCSRAPAILADGRIVPIAILVVSHFVATAALLVQLVSPFVLRFLPWRHASCLLYFPLFLVWKLSIALKSRPRTWVRTAREPLHPA